MSEPHFVRKIAVMAGFILRVFLLLSSVFILERDNMTARKKILLFIPATLNAIVMLYAMFTDKVFYIDSNNILCRKPLSFTPHVLSLVYFFVVLCIAIKRNSLGYKEEGRMLFVTLVGIMVGVTSEVVLETRGIFLSAVSLMLSFYYLYIHIEHFKRDNLTGVLNRMSFYADIKRFQKDGITALCEFDMNNLKVINDTKGHHEGDRAIIAVTNIIQNALPHSSFMYRMGGDEFAVVFCHTDIKTVEGVMQKIRSDMSNTEFSCAMGMAEWNPEISLTEIYNIADKRMYEDKYRMKANDDMQNNRS
ncbi:MAG: GGDEF domain-containing protein [Treponema sp.]|nr:GGDEF domain-containing protein [Treponema sp.]